jgi:aminoglycoside 3-N-acetyltransferase
MSSDWGQRWRRQLKPLYRAGQRAVARALYPYSTAMLEAKIREVGIQTGDAVLVHSGFRRTSGFAGTPNDVIESLRRVVGADGHVLMMSIPYRGSSQRYAEANPVFDVKRTPSAVGLISEMFRRRDDVVRSLNPLHPVLASGPLARWFTLDHDKTAHSCGRGSPFERLLHANGKFLFYDAPYTSLTFMHYVEDMFQPRLPFALYDPVPAVMRVLDDSGVEHETQQYFFSREARERRNFGVVEAALRRDAAIRSAKVGNTRLLSVAARDVVATAGRLLEQGQGFFR